MTKNDQAKIDDLVSTFLGKAAPPEMTEEVRSVHREEVLIRLGAILDAAFKKTVNSRQSTQTQQRWFTICGYLAQVMARVVRDMEYEKLRAEMDDLKEDFAAKDDNTTGRAGIPFRSEAAKAPKS